MNFERAIWLTLFFFFVVQTTGWDPPYASFLLRRFCRFKPVLWAAQFFGLGSRWTMFSNPGPRWDFIWVEIKNQDKILFSFPLHEPPPELGIRVRDRHSSYKLAEWGCIRPALQSSIMALVSRRLYERKMPWTAVEIQRATVDVDQGERVIARIKLRDLRRDEGPASAY